MTSRPRTAAFLAFLLSALLRTSLAAPAPLPTHAELLRRMPPEITGRLGALPDANGLVGHNREGFTAAALQRGATVKLAFAAARGDEKLAEDCWRAVEVAFAHQSPEGNFGDPATSVAFWLCELGRTLLVLQQSPLAARFHDRIAALTPKIALAAHWLAAERARLQRGDRHAPNRLFFDAAAFLFSGQLTGDPGLLQTGHEFIDQGMALYRPADGVFLEHDGADSSYQAVNLLRLQEIVLHFPEPRLEAAIAKGMEWEIARIGPDGTVSTEGNTRVYPGGEKFLGTEKQVNVGEIALALLYYHERTGDPAAAGALERLRQAAQKR
jgi:hypothetical protein